MIRIIATPLRFVFFMGNCLDAIQRCLSNRTDEPTRTRYRTTQVENIKFENLLDVEKRESANRHPLVTESELKHVREGRYDRLVEDQRLIDSQMDEELKQQEELLKREEEAYYSTKRQASKKGKLGKQNSLPSKSSGVHLPSWLTGSAGQSSEGNWNQNILYGVGFKL